MRHSTALENSASFRYQTTRTRKPPLYLLRHACWWRILGCGQRSRWAYLGGRLSIAISSEHAQITGLYLSHQPRCASDGRWFRAGRIWTRGNTV